MTGAKLGVNPVSTIPEGRMNSSVLAPFLVTPPGNRPFHFQPITTLSPFASGTGGGEHVEPFGILGLVRRPVHRPREAVPVGAAGERELGERRVVAVDQRERALARDPMLGGIELERDVGPSNVGQGRVQPGLEILGPVVLVLLLRDAAADAGVHLQHENDAGDNGNRADREEPHAGPDEVARREPVHRADRVRAAPPQEKDRERREEYGQAQNHHAIPDQGGTVGLEEPEIAPAERAPQGPVPRPAHLLRQRAESGEDENPKGHGVRHVPIADQRVGRGDERGPREEGRNQKQAPDQ